MEKELTLLEKYYPKTFEDLILPTRVKNILLKTKDKSNVRILLYSGPGTGKTTSSRILTLGGDNLYLSGSNDVTIDVLRQKVMTFAGGMSVMRKQKNIIIDECDRLKPIIQDAFKIIIDTTPSVNYYFMTNNIEDIIGPLRSRFTNIDYDFSGDDLIEQKKLYINFILMVCKNENIVYENSGIKLLFQLNYPDFRHILVLSQQLIDSKESATVENIKKFSESGKQIKELYELIENPKINEKLLYTELTKFKGKEKDCFLSLGEPFFEYLNSKDLFEKTLDSAIIVSKYSNVFVTSINKFTDLFSCVIELKTLFR